MNKNLQEVQLNSADLQADIDEFGKADAEMVAEEMENASPIRGRGRPKSVKKQNNQEASSPSNLKSSTRKNARRSASPKPFNAGGALGNKK